MLVKKVLALLLAGLVFLTPVGVSAQDGLVPCGPDGGGSSENVSGCEIGDLFDLIRAIYNWLLGLAAVVAMLLLVFGGVRLMWYSWFAESPEEELASAKLTIRRALAGLAIIAVAYLLVFTLLTVLGVEDGGVKDGPEKYIDFRTGTSQ